MRQLDFSKHPEPLPSASLRLCAKTFIMVRHISLGHAPVAYVPHAGHGEHPGFFQGSFQRQDRVLRSTALLTGFLWLRRGAVSRLGLVERTPGTCCEPSGPISA